MVHTLCLWSEKFSVNSPVKHVWRSCSCRACLSDLSPVASKKRVCIAACVRGCECVRLYLRALDCWSSPWPAREPHANHAKSSHPNIQTLSSHLASSLFSASFFVLTASPLSSEPLNDHVLVVSHRPLAYVHGRSLLQFWAHPAMSAAPRQPSSGSG